MTNNESNSEMELVFSSNEPLRVRRAVLEDLDIWAALKRTVVVTGATVDPVGYRRALYRDAAARISVARILLSEDAYIAECDDFASGEFGALASPDIFKPIEPDRLAPGTRDRLRGALGRLSKVAPRASGDDAPVYGLGVTSRAVAGINAGTLMIRRHTGTAVSHHVLPRLMLDQARGALIAGSPAHHVSAGRAAVPGQLVAVAEFDDTQQTILSTLSELCGVLSYIPEVGPVFAILQGAFNIISLIEGNDGPSEYEQLMSALNTIITDALIEASIREQLANIATFMDQYRSDQSTLEKSPNRPNYITTTYLPLLNGQLNSTATGTVNNSIHQLKELYNDTPWSNITIVEQILSALALGVGYRLVLHRTRVMLYGELAANAKEQGQSSQYLTYNDSMIDSLNQYGDVVNDSDMSARALVSMMDAYESQRFASSSVYWGSKPGFLCTTFYVCDRLDNDRTLEWANFYGSYQEGADWAQRTRDAHYAQITGAANANVMPIRDDAISMVDAYYQLKRAQDDEPEPVFDAALTWSGNVCYFFAERKYTAYNMVTDENFGTRYPASVSGNWPGMTGEFETPDAAIYWNSSAAYFFKGDQYIKFDIPNNRVADGYPAKISSGWNNWPASFTSVDAALSWDSSVCYFFKGDEYIAFDIAADRVRDGYPKKIADGWPGWPSSFNDLGCAVDWNNGCAYFFKGTQYIRFNKSLNKVDGGPSAVSAGWPTLMWW